MRKEKQPRSALLSFQDIVKQARENLFRQGYHVPTLIIDGTREFVIMQLTALSPEPAERATQLFHLGVMLARARDVGSVKQVFFVSQARSHRDPKHSLGNNPARQKPTPDDLLLISALSPQTSEANSATFKITRQANGRATDVHQMIEQPEDSIRDTALLHAFMQGFGEDGKAVTR